MKKPIVLLISLVLAFTALFSYATRLVYADEDESVVEGFDEQHGETVTEEILFEEPEADNGLEDIPDNTQIDPGDQAQEDGLDENGNSKAAPTNVAIVENENGDLVIYCDDPIWLENLQKGGCYDDVNNTYTDYGRITLRSEDQEYDRTIQNYDGDKDFVLSSDHTLLTVLNRNIINSIENGSYTVTFIVLGYEDLTLNTKLNITKGRKTAPDSQDLSVICVNDQIIITSNDSDWLKAVAKYSVSTRTTEGGSSYESGGYVTVYSEDSASGWFSANFENIRRYTNEELVEERDEIVYSNGSLILPKKSILAKRVTSGTYDFWFSAYGYTETSVDDIVVTTSVKTQLPDDINVYYDGGLFIESSDKEWLAGIAENDNNDQHIVAIRELQEGDYTYDQEYYFCNTNYYHIIDFDGNKVFISEGNLVNYRYLPTDDYRFVIKSNGYVADYEYTERHHIEGIENAPSDLSAYQNEEGDLIIETDNKDYLRLLTKDSEINQNNEFTSIGSNIAITSPRSISGNAVRKIKASDKEMFANTAGKKKITYDETNGKAVIKAGILLNNGLVSGTYSIWATSYGYTFARINGVDLDLDHIIRNAPSDVEIRENENGDLILYCSDNDWNDMLCRGHNEQTGGNYGEIVFYQGDKRCGMIVFGMEGIMFGRSDDGKTLTVPNAMLINSAIVNGNYTVSINVEGYENAVIDPLSITKGLKTVPADIRVSSSNDNIYIYSDDSDFINALAEANMEGTDENGDWLYVENSHLEFNSVDENCNYTGLFGNWMANADYYEMGVKKFSDVTIVLDGNRLVIPAKRVLSMRMPSSRYLVTLYAKGYSRAEIYADIVTSINTNVPTDIDISFDETKGVVIGSSDTKWLDAIVNGGSVGLNLDPMGGYWFVNYGQSKPLVRQGNTVVVSAMYLYNYVPEGDYLLIIEPEKYIKYQYGIYDHQEQAVKNGLHVNPTSNGVKYTVTYNANGGKGTMYKQEGYSGIDLKLFENHFSKANHTFVGWSRTAKGSVEYLDEEEINLYLEKTANITLYAVWEPIPVENITVTGNARVAAGKSTKLTATVSPSDAANRNVVWSVEKVTRNSDPEPITDTAELKKYATVSNGTVSAKKVNEICFVTIKATAKDGSGVFGTCTVQITPAVDTVFILDDEGKDVSKQTIGIDPEFTREILLSATTNPDDASKDVTWTSSNVKLATVDEYGYVRIGENVSKGTVRITAKATDGTNKNTYVTLNIAKLAQEIIVYNSKDRFNDDGRPIYASGNAKVSAGKSTSLKAMVLPSDTANKAVSWSIEEGWYYDEEYNTKTISKELFSKYLTLSAGGVVTAKTVKLPEDKIMRFFRIRATAKDGSGVFGEYTVRILPIVESLSLMNDNGVIIVNNTIIDLRDGADDGYWLYVVANPADASPGVTWKSSNTSVAQVDVYGYVSFSDKHGTVKITATATDGSGKSVSVTFRR